MEEMLLSALYEAGVPKKFWAECLAAHVYVWNQCPTSAVPDSTPYERWYKKKPKVGHLRVWGCVAYVYIQKDKRPHLGFHSEKCIFIGYPEGVKGWRFWNPETKKVIISERAEFDERYMYNVQSSKGKQKTLPAPDENPKFFHLAPGTVNDDDYETDSDDELPALNPNNPPPNDDDDSDNNNDNGDNPQNQQDLDLDDEPADNRPIALRKPVRNRNPPGEY